MGARETGVGGAAAAGGRCSAGTPAPAPAAAAALAEVVGGAKLSVNKEDAPKPVPGARTGTGSGFPPKPNPPNAAVVAAKNGLKGVGGCLFLPGPCVGDAGGVSHRCDSDLTEHVDAASPLSALASGASAPDKSCGDVASGLATRRWRLETGGMSA